MGVCSLVIDIVGMLDFGVETQFTTWERIGLSIVMSMSI